MYKYLDSLYACIVSSLGEDSVTCFSVTIQANSLTLETGDRYICVQCPQLNILADQHPVFTLEVSSPKVP